MTDLVYILIYLFPLLLISTSEVLPRLPETAKAPKHGILLLLMLLTALLLTAIVNAGNKFRIIILSVLSALILGILSVTNGTKRREWLEANPWIGTVLVVVLVVVVLETLMLRVRALKLTAGLLLLGVLLSSFWTEWIGKKGSLVAIVFLTLTILTEEIRRYKRGEEGNKAFVVRIAPFLVLGMVALYFLPHSAKPYDWDWAKRMVRKVADEITELLHSFEKGDSVGEMNRFIGFSEGGNISANIGNDKKLMLKVKVGSDAPAVLYLDGKYFEDFDGNEWKEAGETYPYMMDTAEAACLLSMQDVTHLHDYRRLEEISVTYQGENTSYVLAPAKSYASSVQMKNNAIDFTKNELRFRKKSGYNTEYTIRYLILNRNREVMLSLLGQESEITQRLWEKECAELSLDPKIYSYQNYLTYRTRLYDKSFCPNAVKKENLSAEVSEFLAKATEGADNDFDKLLALEKAFGNFEYTLSPGELPEAVDTPEEFLDYFLIDSAKGYCNRFATAFVLLCQAEGIPARYVHGYLVSRGNENEIDVYNYMAHAYAEVYLKGIGWLVFDPTPGTDQSAWSWEKRKKQEGTVLPALPTEKEPHGPNGNDKNETESTGKASLHWYTIAIPAAFSLLALTLVVLVERAVKRKHYERLSPEEKAHNICLRMMKVLKRMGVAREDHETVSEYAARVWEKKGISVNSFAKIFEKLIYSSQSPNDAEFAELSREYDTVYGQLSGTDRIWAAVLRFLLLL